MHDDRTAIIERIDELFLATDARAWDRVRACFTPELTFDMSSLTGQPASRVSAESVAAGWEQGLAPIESVHHQSGNHVVTVSDGEATASCYAIALHYRKTTSGRNTRTFVGSYDYHLVRDGATWRIDEFRFNLKFIDGNTALESD